MKLFDLSGRVAVVILSAQLPHGARDATKIAVSVSAIGDARSIVGGTLLVAPLRDADGTEYPVGGAFREVVEPARLVFTELSLDRQARLLFKAPTTVTFAERAARTELTVHVRAIALDETGEPMIGAMDKGGWGLYLIRKLMDEVVFEKVNAGTCIRMTKRRVPCDPCPTT